ncbi:MAG: hypothetical protein EYC68_18815 [Chloroflexota bacterium]|nr:MAG: hypothetical protein EYC68_18815 [Chloroflexota bacterium]
MQPKKTWYLIATLAVLLGAILIGMAWMQTEMEPAAMLSAGLSEEQVVQLAKEALAAEYSGAPTQITVRQTTVGELDKFHCGAIGAMISVIVSPLQGNPDICAADSTVWVVSLRGEFLHENFVTESVQVVLDRSGRMMAIDSGELILLSTPTD